jgi:hypothetical protein
VETTKTTSREWDLETINPSQYNSNYSNSQPNIPRYANYDNLKNIRYHKTGKRAEESH